MRLKSVTLKGFKSFPDRTRLDFGPGVSVVVGPNGSGKSNVTDAVLWAMGEQSPLAVRGQSMQDVIFGGGRGVQARNAAEVEIVLDNSDDTVDLPLSEISIVRRLERSGEGGYRLNGARCRLSDVIEVLSDTGLGKETHSVISQGRVEAIVTSKARDRRMLIEEAAGLGKHRKRRRRAQLKLERTQENLDRALDVEREARTRLRPLKRQAEAAELHERLERQTLEARWELAQDAAGVARVELAQAQARAVQARAAREQIEARLQETVARRGRAERALSERAERHDELSRLLYAGRSAHERLGLRGEQAAAAAQTISRRIAWLRTELGEPAAEPQSPGSEPARSPEPGAAGKPSAAERSSDAEEAAAIARRIAELESELAELDARRELELGEQLAELEQALAHEQAGEREAGEQVTAALQAREQADRLARAAREQLTHAEHSVEQARRESARIGAELAAANQFLRAHAAVHGGTDGGPRPLSEDLRVREGYELALAAALGGRLDAAVVESMASAESLLDHAGPDGATALLAGGAPPSSGGSAPSPAMPAGARRLLDLLDGPEAAMDLARRLLSGTWVVERLEDVPEAFGGIAVTRAGRVWFAAWGEVRQLAEGGTERVLARRNERDRLIGAMDRSAQSEQAARARVEAAREEVQSREGDRGSAEEQLRTAQRGQTEAAEAVRRSRWLIEQRRAAPAEGPSAVRRAELEGALSSERAVAARLAREAEQARARVAQARLQLAADLRLAPRAERLRQVLHTAAQAVQGRFAAIERELAEDRSASEQMAGELRECAAREAELQSELRGAGEAVTVAEVATQRVRDQADDAELELKTVAERLELPPPAPVGDGPEGQPPARLGEEQVQALRAKLERLERRREQLGPVNPLAKDEYAEAVAHVEELEARREDLETALRELRGVIRETDRQIQETFAETFEAAARNFEELVGDVFPGGSGRLRLVSEERPPRSVLGGQSPGQGSDTAAAVQPIGAAAAGPASEASAEIAEEAAEQEAEREEQQEEDLLGVEIEITPAGKSTKRLSLLSGGEKSMTALAFLFAVFLARPCPFYILDEVEAALDDLNLDRFLTLLRRYSDRAQFIVITHQKRTMEAADWLFGVSMGGDGVSKVLSRRLPAERENARALAEGPGNVARVA